jgi:hypothetical protein
VKLEKFCRNFPSYISPADAQGVREVGHRQEKPAPAFAGNLIEFVIMKSRVKHLEANEASSETITTFIFSSFWRLPSPFTAHSSPNVLAANLISFRFVTF